MTWEPLSNIIADDLYSCAVYAKKLKLLNTQGPKQLKRQASTAKTLIRTLKKNTDKPRHPGDISIDTIPTRNG